MRARGEVSSRSMKIETQEEKSWRGREERKKHSGRSGEFGKGVHHGSNKGDLKMISNTFFCLSKQG